MHYVLLPSLDLRRAVSPFAYQATQALRGCAHFRSCLFLLDSGHVDDTKDWNECSSRNWRCQRGVDVPSFQEAIVRGVRMDPDVMMVGEMRDLATMEAAITAAETGHLVFATLHTTGASRTVDRIIDAFPTTQQEQIRAQLASSIVAVVSQLLLPHASGKGRIASFEIMIATPSIQNLIRDKKTYRIHSDIQTGAKYGMITMDAHLSELYQREDITYDALMSHAYDLEGMVGETEEQSPRGKK